MITINHPFIRVQGNETFLCSIITDEYYGRSFEVWFSVDNKYAEYLCEDRADAFLMVYFMIAMKSHQDIKIEAPVSQKLLFNFENTIQPLFEYFIPESNSVKIISKEKAPERFSGNAVGCGCSLGVDSLSSFLKHYGDNVIPDYRATHLTIFNVGHFGYTDPKAAEVLFRKAVVGLDPFSKEVNMPVIAVNTNFNELFMISGFDTMKCRFIPSTLSCVLALQKLFGKYVFASSYPVDKFAILPNDHSHAESAFVPLMSTESTEIILSNPCMTRVDKTKFISQHPLTHKFLDVCWAGQQAYGAVNDNKYLIDKTKKNCGWCDKCLRTLFTLELFGCDLNMYNEGFDLDKYHEHKEEFVATVLAKRNKNIYYKEIYRLMLQVNYHISIRVHLKKLSIKARIVLANVRNQVTRFKGLLRRVCN